VPYAGKRSNRFFLGQVTGVDVKYYEMTFLKKMIMVKCLHFPQKKISTG
jgi:hypothetical protein